MLKPMTICPTCYIAWPRNAAVFLLPRNSGNDDVKGQAVDKVSLLLVLIALLDFTGSFCLLIYWGNVAWAGLCYSKGG
jgi:hypothetical protein